jgi:hypothetical protein
MNVHLKLQRAADERRTHVHLHAIQMNVHMTLPWMNVHRVLHLHGLSGTMVGNITHILRQARLKAPMTMQEAVALAHLRVAEWEPDDEDDEVVVSIPALPVSPPQLLPVPAAWWDTPAVTCRPLNPVPEEARTARLFVRELLSRWDLGYLSDDAELIIAELVVNAVEHGLNSVAPSAFGAPPAALRLCMLRRVGEVMLAVTDPSADAPAPKAPTCTGESGRGLQIVSALSYVWGWSPLENQGKAVWAVLRS